MTYFKWLFNNLSNIFSFIGIVLTIYFGVYYIPSYVTSVREEKIISAKKDIIVTIQELLFNKRQIKLNDVVNVIHGKEIQYQINIPDTPQDIILQTEATIYDQKFLNLDSRLAVISKLDSLNNNRHPVTFDSLQNVIFEKPSIYSNTISIFTTIFALLISVIAFISAIIKIRKEKEQEVINSVSEREDEILESAQNAFDFEKNIKDIVSRIVERNPNTKLAVAFSEDRGWDFRIDYRDKVYLAEIRYVKNKSLNVSVIDNLFSSMKMFNAVGLIITNKFVGVNAQAAINAINHKSKTLKILTVEKDYEDTLTKIIFNKDNI